MVVIREEIFLKKVEKIFKNKFFIILFTCISLFFVLIMILYNIIFVNVRNRTFHEQISSETQLIANRIHAQEQTDFQLLDLLRNFLLNFDFDFDSAESSSLEHLLNCLLETNYNNKFVRMSVVADGQIYHTDLDGQIRYENFIDANPILKEGIELSYQGKANVTTFFYDDFFKTQVSVISIPIIQNDEVLGVLAGYNTISFYEDIIRDVMTRYLVVNLIDADGNVFVELNRLKESDINNIFGLSIVESVKYKLQSSLEMKENFDGIVSYDGKLYVLNSLYLGFNDWFLFTFSPLTSNTSVIYNILSISQILFIIMIFTFIFFVLLAYYVFNGNQKKIERLAYYDDLTGLLSFNGLKHLFTEKSNMEKYAIVHFNIINFQSFNNIFGEASGSKLLVNISRVFQTTLTDEEHCCRINSDHFILILKRSTKDNVIKVINEINDKIVKIVKDNHSNYKLQLCFGIAYGSNFYDMIINANWAMKDCKEDNKLYSFYDDRLDSQISLKLDIENVMNESLINKEFKLFLQPKYDLLKDKVVGAEALVRWIRDDNTIYFPDQFIPIFESNGFCVELDIYMIDLVCQTLRNWIDLGHKVYPISINQSKLMFYKTDYVEQVTAIVDKYQIDHSLIELEILEGLSIRDLNIFNEVIDKLNKNGFRVSLDDFGSGFSSLGNLTDLKIDEIKLDRKFLKLVDNDEEHNIPILEKIFLLINSIGVDVVCEGVETAKHVEILKKMKCKFAQGYFYSRPISANDYYNKYIKNDL